MSRSNKYTSHVDGITRSEWDTTIANFRDANIYQTWAYGATHWGEEALSHLILRKGSVLAAVAQVATRQIPGIKAGIAYLRWGPLCEPLDNELQPDAVYAMATSLHHEYVRNRGLLLEVVPNSFEGSASSPTFRRAFSIFTEGSATGHLPHRTLVLDISTSLDNVRKAFDKKWRNQLTCAETKNLEIREGTSDHMYQTFCSLYNDMRQLKSFDSQVSIREFDQIQHMLHPSQKMEIFLAYSSDAPVAGVVCSILADTAIYLLGASTALGRELKASYLLQWKVVQRLKTRNVRHYDLGGINPDDNPGVFHFKRGLAGTDRTHIGPFVACDNRLSLIAVRIGQFLRHARQRLRTTM